MAAIAYLDTHVATWLYARRLDLLPKKVRSVVDSHDLLVSPMVVLELQYLFEIKRIAAEATTVVAALGAALGLAVCDLPFDRVANVALEQRWTRDPFDRLIVSHALARNVQLLTKDETIRQNCTLAVWDDS